MPRPSAAVAQPAPQAMAPVGFATELASIVAGFDGRVGVAVHDVREGWTASVDGLSPYPQQSVSKLWVALAVFQAIDQGRLTLDHPVLVQREDMSVFHQPIQAMLTPGGFQTTIDALLVGAIAQSDNAANDILVKQAGGSRAVQRVIAAKGLGAIHAGPEEKVLQSRIAGMAWRPEYSFGHAFWDARDRVPPGVRSARLATYLRAPDDGATPEAMVEGLARLARGELLSPASTARFLQVMASTETGPDRLKAGLGPGWRIAHKTGTGQVMGLLATGYNDVGLITAPDGHDYAVAVMMASTQRPIPERQAMMASVARAVVALHDGVPASQPLPGQQLSGQP